MTLRTGLGLITGQVPPGSARTVAEEYRDILVLARVADRSAFHSLWVSEHHGAEDSYLPALLPMLAALAAVTDRLLLGTAVVLAPFQDPLRFAEDCAVVDQLSRGRLLVGLGGGWRRKEFAAFGIPLSERASRTAELVAICRAAWGEGSFSHGGRHFTYRDVTVTPKPYRRVPLLLGGSAPASIARAGRLADGFIGTPAGRLDVFREHVAQFDAAARAAGRDPLRLPIGLHVNAWISQDGGLPDDIRAAMWHQAGTYAMWHAQDEGSDTTTLPPLDEAFIRSRAFIGTGEQIVAQLRPWVEEFGHRELHLIVRLHYPGMSLAPAERAVRAFAAEVIPALEALVA